jgi:hypothetical protein
LSRQCTATPARASTCSSDCFDCGLSQEDAREELQRIERSLINEDAVADALEFMDEYGDVFKGLAD